MDLLWLACSVGVIGIIVFIIGLFLGRLFGTIQKISNALCQPLNLSFIHQSRIYLTHPNQILHPQQLRLYLRSEISVAFVFLGALAILVAAVIVTIVVFWRALV